MPQGEIRSGSAVILIEYECDGDVLFCKHDCVRGFINHLSSTITPQQISIIIQGGYLALIRC